MATGQGLAMQYLLAKSCLRSCFAIVASAALLVRVASVSHEWFSMVAVFVFGKYLSTCSEQVVAS